MSNRQFSINKISPPASGKVLFRDRLFSLFDQPCPPPSFWISGPGGSGKTTLVASYLSQQNLPCLWYQIDALDSDPATFFYYLGQAAAPLLDPDEPPLPLLTPEYLLGVDTFIIRYFETLFQCLKSPCWIVFDNFQEAEGDSPVQQIVARAIGMLPQNITIAIVSRSDPPPAMARFRANQKLSIIDWNQIAFTRDESQDLIKLSGYRLDKKEAEKIFQFTRGWVAGIILWLQQSENETTSQNLPKDTTPESIFDYFVGEILEKIDPETTQFFLKTALLPHMTADMAGQMTGMAAEDILEDLSRQNYFLGKKRSPFVSYQYHPLFHDFLRARASHTFGSAPLKDLLIQAAEILINNGFIEEAVDLYIQANEYEPLIGLLLSQAPVLISQGRHRVLCSWIDSLPAEYSKQNPWLLFWQGMGLLPTQPHEGRTLCIKAYELFGQANDLPGRILSWSTIAETYLIFRGVVTPLDRWITEGEQLGELITGKVDANTLGRFAGSMLTALLMRDHGHPDIGSLQEQCEKLLQQCTDEQVLASLSSTLCFSYFWLGQIYKSHVMLTALQPLPDPVKVSPAIRIGYNTIKCLLLLSKGNWTQCRLTVEKTVTLAQESGVHIHDSLLFTYGAYSGFKTGDLDTAHHFLKRLEKSLLPHAVFDIGQYHFSAAWLALEKEDLSKAKIQCETALDLVHESGSPFAIACTTLLLTQLLLENGDVDLARKKLNDLKKNPRLNNSRQIHFSVQLVLADCACMQNREDDAHWHLLTAFSEARKNGLNIPLGLFRKRLSVLCAKALEADIETETVTQFIKLGRFQPPSLLSGREEWPWPLKIYTLGQLEIYCQGKRLTLSTKTPKKPLELLKFLICTQGRKIARETVADRLWPEADGDRSILNLKTTLHRLRKLLRRNQAVIMQKGRLFLNTEICWVDAWHFDELVQQADAATNPELKEELTMKALSLYRGTFGLSQGYNSVLVGYTEQLREKWADAVDNYCRELVEMHQAEEALDMLQKALTLDSSVERLYQLFMSICYNEGRTNEAMAVFDRCRIALAELGMTPSDNMIALYNECMRN